MATPDALSFAPGPPESASPWAQNRMYFVRSRPGSVATTVEAPSVPDVDSSAKDARIRPPDPSSSRSGAVSFGPRLNTGIVHVPRRRPGVGQPDVDTRPSNSTAAQPAVFSGVGFADTRQTAPCATPSARSPSPFADGDPELGQAVSSRLPGAPAPPARTSHVTGWYHGRGESLRMSTLRPASRNATDSQAAAAWFEGVPYIRVPRPTSLRTASVIRASETEAARARSAVILGFGDPFWAAEHRSARAHDRQRSHRDTTPPTR